MPARTSRKANSTKPKPKTTHIRKINHKESLPHLKLAEAETCLSIPEDEVEAEGCSGMIEVNWWPEVGRSLWEQLVGDTL